MSASISPTAAKNTTPNQLSKQPNTDGNKRKTDDDQALREALEQLDRRNDCELEQ
ncbi:hypothetical protein DPMN_080810 [Dreissena polymorpha]|uniref:Uncharacterized protein n=1 Tax=Dreissena polymorpha TaxID=45954 RepID=A0A9D3YS28_DREPO|nr:hypothetical protein DPMN_080810 [Dreissena polymorpha]